jgi:ketosteroid isomerase-like protein
MRAFTFTIAWVLAVVGAIVFARVSAAAQPTSEVLAAEDARFAAMLRADTAALADMLADDLLYVHTTARVETKAQFVTAVGSGAIQYLSFVPMERRVTLIAPGAALVTGRAKARVIVAGPPTDSEVRYIAVYTRLDDQWQLRGWQTTRIPAPSGR